MVPRSPYSIPKFSVVIPTCERPDFLATCLLALAPGQQTLSTRDYEVIVSDDGSAQTAERLITERFAWARWTKGPCKGPAANRNHGATVSTGEWIAFLDDDCVPSRGWLEAYVRTAQQRPEAQVLEGPTLPVGPRNSIDTEAPINTSGGFLWSCNFAIRRSQFIELNGFDSGFPGPAMEDVELRTRLRKRGAVMAFAAEAIAHHPWRPRKGCRFVRLYVQSVDYFLSKHPDESGLFSVPMLIRVLVAGTARNIREAFRVCGGRGIGRLVWLELYTFFLLSWRTLRR